GEFVNPFKRLYTGHYKYSLDIEKIKEAMPDVEGTHDYSSFVASRRQSKSHVRTIYEAKEHEDKVNDEIEYEFYTNRHLHNIVSIKIRIEGKQDRQHQLVAYT